MPRAKKRDNGYYLKRLERDHPSILARLKSGKIPTARQAFIAAGLVKERGGLDILKRGWRRASTAERKAFVAWALGGGVGASTRVVLVDGDGYLSSGSIRRIQKVMAEKGLKVGDVMQALGYKRLDTRLGSALQRRWRPGRDFLDRLSRWLARAVS